MNKIVLFLWSLDYNDVRYEHTALVFQKGQITCFITKIEL